MNTCDKCKELKCSESGGHQPDCPLWEVDPAEPKVRAKVVCFSGSSKFIDMMSVLMWEEEKKGNITLGCHLLPEWYKEFAPGGVLARHHQAEQEGVAAVLDEVHLRKIDLCDELFVVDVQGYFGDSTRREIEYARSQGKNVRFLSGDPAYAKLYKESLYAYG